MIMGQVQCMSLNDDQVLPRGLLAPRFSPLQSPTWPLPDLIKSLISAGWVTSADLMFSG